MGTEFFWFYDVILIAIIIGTIFLGVKRGFVRMLLSLASIAIAFVAALVISDGVSSWIYESFVEQNLKASISDTINDAIGENVVTELTKVDMDKAIIAGKPLVSMDNSLKVDDAGKITLDLSSVNLTKTGIDKVDLATTCIVSRLYDVELNTIILLIEDRHIILGGLERAVDDGSKKFGDTLIGKGAENNLPAYAIHVALCNSYLKSIV